MSLAESQKTASSILGARASNAGDMFHELWALKAALGLLIPRTELKAVTVEGISASPSAGYQYDGVDCGLFYGGSDLESSTKLEFLQLKYSTGSPTKAWSVARLTATSAKKNGNNSVLRKLAETYSQATKKVTPGAEIIIRLVSNQPIDPAVNTAINKILNSDITEGDASKIISASGLKGDELSLFLRALDFSQTGVGSRTALQDSVTSTVSEIINGNADTQILMLQQRIRNLMLPGAELEKINQKTVLSWFGLSSIAGLFPAPQDLQSAANPIPRQPVTELIEAMGAGIKLVCLHGPGGCGKTTSMMQATTLLPTGSISIVFDCYGAGRYNHSNDRRHLPENAFLQIVNELAWALETPFVVAKSSTNPIEIVTFLERINQAAKILADANKDAFLAIFIDAADNSITAAERSQPPTPCFVWEIAEADLNNLPSNVHIVISTRTARKPKLRLPSGTPEVLCPPFILEETAAFARSRQPKISEDWIKQFQMLSSGIPRVQTYAFAKGGASTSDVLEALRPSGKKLDTVLRELFHGASVKSGDEAFYRRCVAALAILPAPVPVKHLASLCHCSEGAIIDFAMDVQPTLRIEDNTVTIADEDVEDFLQDESSSQTDTALTDICQHFMTLYKDDAYAAIHYCDLLARASRAAEILPIIERDLLPAGISDPIQSREVQLRRLRLALAACRSTEHSPDTLKVILLSAEAAKDEDALKELLERETDLSVRFAGASLMRLILSDRDRYPRQGTILAQDSARAAYAGDRVSARECLSAYSQWMRRRQEANTRPKAKDWNVEFDDIVALEEAVAMLDGAKACKDSLMHWKPIENWPRVALQLIPRLIRRGKLEIVENAYQQQILPQPWSLLLTVPLALAGFPISTELLSKELSNLRKSNVPDPRNTSSQQKNWKLPFLELIVTACEIGLSRQVSPSVLLRALNLVLDNRSSSSSRIAHTDALKMDIALRAWLLREFLNKGTTKSPNFIQWIKDENSPPPKKVRGRKKKVAPSSRSERSDDEVAVIINAIFPVYASRLNLLSEASVGEIVEKPKAVFYGLGRDTYSFDRNYWSTEFRRRAGQSVARLMHITGLSISYLYEHAETIARGQYDDAFATRSLAMWGEFLLRPSMHAVILDKAAVLAKKLLPLRTGSKSKAETLLNLTRLVLNFSDADAKTFFEKAVEIVQEIDREAMVQIEFFAGLSLKNEDFTVDVSRTLAGAYSAFVTDVAIRLEGEDYFPWQKATQAITQLAPEIGFATISQWQDEGLASYHTTLPTLLKSISSLSNEKALTACALSILLGHPPVELIEELAGFVASANHAQAYEVFELLASDCLLHIRSDDRIAAGKSLLGKVPLDLTPGPRLQKLKDTIAFCELPESVDSAIRAEKTLEIKFAEGADFFTVDGIKAAIKYAQAFHAETYVPLRLILTAARQHIVTPAQRIPYLHAISAFDGDSLNAEDRADSILAALEVWHNAPAVESWRTSELPKIISENLWPLARWLNEPSRSLPTLLNATNLTGRDRIDVIARGLEAGADNFSSPVLFGLASLMTPGLSPEGIKELSEWFVNRLHSRVPADIQARYDLTEIPTDFHEALGRFLFAQMSDIDVRLRWRAAHCLRRLVSQLGDMPLKSLFLAYDRTSEASFRLRDAPFYWLAARLWATVTAARIASENPQKASAIFQKLLAIAVDKKLPHYLIKRNAKQAILSLLQAKTIFLSNAKLQTLNAVNQPKMKKIKIEKRGYRELQRVDSDTRRFKFGSLDTIPYWYSPLYRHFATLTAENFYSTLEKWLIDKWGVDPEANWWDKEPRKSRFDERNQLRSHNGHGSLPTIERYGTYLEWHVMFCGLGEWLEKEPLAVPEWSSDELEYWAKQWSVTEPPTWLSDRRGFLPLEKDFFFEEGGADTHWLRRIPRTKFLSAIIGNDPKCIVVDGSWTISRLKRETRISLNTALVESKTAIALARVVQSAETYKFYLPYEKDGDETDSNELNEPPFVLRAWLTSTHLEREFDSADPLRNQVGVLSAAPAKWLSKKFKLKPEGKPVSLWSQPKGKEWFCYNAWSDLEESEADYSYSRRRIGTFGHRLKVDREALLSILVSEKADLIVKVEIERRLENEYGPSNSWDDKKKRQTTHKVFIFRQDGTIEDESGYIATWFRAGQSAGPINRARSAGELDGASSRGKASG